MHVTLPELDMSRSFRPLTAAPLVVLALLLVLAGCTDGGAGTTTGADDVAAGEGVRVASAGSVAALLEAEPDRKVIDVRTPEEFAAGHLEGAVLVDYNAPDFAARIAEFDRDEPYVIYCRSGNRSAGARDVMEELGFTDVVDVEGGIVAWTDADLPVTSA